ncbi:MAG: DUF418 domain-containing protein [Sphingomonadaceae bacterium]|nr:DUF418 domain-containing protein [Sphingomonadaceae bacterium]
MPSPTDSRILTLDAIRGVAVLGILLMNIVAFAMPSQAYINPLAYRGDTPLDIAVWATNFVFADGKFRGLFTALFGASMLLVATRAEAKGENPALVHYSRMSWLLLLGAVHALAIWYGDILILYAAIGMIAFLFRDLPVRNLVVAGLCLIVAQAAYLGAGLIEIARLRELATAPGASSDIAAQWHALDTAFAAPSRDALAADIAHYRGSYAEILADRLGPDFWRPIRNNFTWPFDTLGLMLLGMAGLKSGFLTGEWDRRRYARIAAIGYALSIPPLALLALWMLARGFDVVSVTAGDFALKTLFNAPMTLAHAALLLVWIKAAAGGALLARVAAVGRMAFTNYVATSLICTTIFYGYGLGLYGGLDRATLYLVVPAVWALILLWSKPWLDNFAYGPLEWLWRSLARRKFQPMRRARS